MVDGDKALIPDHDKMAERCRVARAVRPGCSAGVPRGNGPGNGFNAVRKDKPVFLFLGAPAPGAVHRFEFLTGKRLP